MFRAERFLADLQRALIERFGLGVVAHGIVKLRQIVEACRGVGMLRAEGFLADLQRALIERFGLGVVAHCSYTAPPGC